MSWFLPSTWGDLIDSNVQEIPSLDGVIEPSAFPVLKPSVIPPIPVSDEDAEEDNEIITVTTTTSPPSPIPSSSLPVFPFDKCSSEEGENCCNGLEVNCQRRVNEIMYATAHNAMSTRDDNFLQPNHYCSLEKSLEFGFRAFTLDLCDCGRLRGLQFCHSVCGLGMRDPRDVLSNIMNFLNAPENQDEIIIIIFQIGKEFGQETRIPLTELEAIIEDIPGFSDMIYKHDDPDNDEWPIIQDLVDVNQRIILFHHETSTCANAGECPSGFLYYFNWVVETPFSFPDEESLFDNVDESCSLDRGSGGQRDFFGVNHFVTKVFAQSDIAESINQRDKIESRVKDCYGVTGLFPNFVQVDFWSISDLPGIVTLYNEEGISLV